jgi:Protein of unknown function (DUF1588)/Protein of unknown function (DUF1592)/Protein of unknown function (DUF1585)/Protein of unknown function (DUF1595)/Protein of unknown function (DUF1587)
MQLNGKKVTAGVTPRRGGSFYWGIAAAAVLGIVGCTHLLNADKSATAQTGAEPSHAADTGPANLGSVPRARLLTSQQYVNLVHDVFGTDIQAGTPIPPMRRTDGLLEISSASVGVTAGQIMQLQRAAASVAQQVVDNGNLEEGIPSHREYLVACKPKKIEAPDDACATKFIASTGRLLFRRPLEKAKLAEFVGKAHEASTKLKDFYAGLSSVLEGMLVDPEVLMVVDRTEPDPNHPGKRRLDGYSLASRLSIFLWNSIPDDRLLKAAESGEINTPAGRARIVEMMVSSPRLENGMRAFFDDMFAFDDFDNLSKDSTVYPKVSGTTLADAREQTLRTVYDHLIVRDLDYRDLFLTRSTLMSPALASIYGVPAVPGWVPYEFPSDSPRVGILSQVSFLAVHSHPGRSSATLRGKALREILLCQKVPSPPPNVDFSIVEDPKANFHTARERLTAHRSNPVCAGCHKITDPIGLALENFDGGGQYRLSERGANIDASGSLDGKEFNDPAGLARAVHDHPALPTCLVKRMYSYGTGGPLGDADKPQLAYLDARFQAAGYKVPELLRAIALSNAFSQVAEVAAAAPPVSTAGIANSSPSSGP